MRKSLPGVLLSGGVLLSAAGTAAAQDSGLAGPGAAVPRMDFRTFVVRKFTEADTNNDGALTQDEIAALEVARFNRLDLDRNGQITRHEFAAPQPPGLSEPELRAWRAHRTRQFGLLDQDNNRRIGVREFTNMVRRSAAHVDADGNGRVSLAEFGESMRRIALGEAKRALPRADSGGARPIARTLRETFDRDGNGRIDKVELDQVLSARFRRGDGNRDGRLALAEILRGGGPEAEIREQFAAQDRNGDGALDLTEFAARWHQVFDTLDRNGDRRLSDPELAAGRY